MKKLIVTSLIASTALVAPAAHAQEDEVSALRAQIDALQAQIELLSNRLDTMETETDATQAAVVANAEAVAATNAAVAAIPAPEDDGVEISFSGAPEIEAPGGWSFKPFGRLNLDAGTVNFPEGITQEDGFGNEMRRARIGVEGDIPGGFGYKVEVDFAGGSGELTDALLTYKDDGLTLTVGQHNNFQSLEELTSSRWSSFIERAAFTDAFGFERRMGVSAQYSAGDVLVQAGVFSDNIEELSNKNWSLDGRLVFSPKLDDTQLHLGGSVHLTELENGSTVRYRQRPLVHFTSQRPIATPTLDASSEFGAGLEAAIINGPFHAVGEAFWQSVNTPGAAADPGFFGGYIEAGLYLTEGDRRGYKGGKFDRTRPNKPVGEGGMGAFQINARYDYLDLNDGAITGGMQNSYQASLVWIPTDYTRLSLSYAHIEYDDSAFALATGERSWSSDVIGLRGQIDF